MEYQQLLKSNVHFGHLTRKWNPKMMPYIFMERQDVHIIDLRKTVLALKEASSFAERISARGQKILFVGTKLQAKDAIQREATRLRMPYVSERWLGGMLTNFATMRRTMRRMQSMDKLMREPAYRNLAKRERLMLQRDKAKREKMLGGILELGRLPDAMFIVDINKESIALCEAQRLNIPIIAMVDTNCDPSAVDYPIPANDDATKSIEAILQVIAAAIAAGAEQRKKSQKVEQSPDTSDAQADSETKSADAKEKKVAPIIKRRRTTSGGVRVAGSKMPRPVRQTTEESSVPVPSTGAVKLPKSEESSVPTSSPKEAKLPASNS